MLAAAAAGTGAHDTGESMEDELLVLPPDDVIQRLQVGSSLLKVSAVFATATHPHQGRDHLCTCNTLTRALLWQVNKKGVASKRHFRLSDDLLKLEWVPSSKSGSVGIRTSSSSSSRLWLRASVTHHNMYALYTSVPLLQVKVVSAGLNSSGFAKSNKAKVGRVAQLRCHAFGSPYLLVFACWGVFPAGEVAQSGGGISREEWRRGRDDEWIHVEAGRIQGRLEELVQGALCG